ncbi:MAG: phage tail tube protein [Burkholderiaceae bacterium]
MDGISFSQSINSSEVTINEAGTTSRRGRLMFNDSLAPVEWSFSTYVRPTTANSVVRSPEEALWAMLVGAVSYDMNGLFYNNATGGSPGSPTFSSNTLGNASTGSVFNFDGSNVSSFSENWTIWVAFVPTGGTAQYYKLTKAVVNSASIDFDIEGIATIAWSGFASSIVDSGETGPVTSAESWNSTALTTTTNFIRNRLSTVNLVDNAVGGKTYTVVLTGGSINIENNITYLTPEELGRVNQPIANITGTRSISGNMTCYLNTGSPYSGQLYADLLADTSTVRNSFDLQINVGGTTLSQPRIVLDAPTSHLEVPAINVEDLLTLDIAFHAHGSGLTSDSSDTDEITVVYNT